MKKNERIEVALAWCEKHKIRTRLNLLDLGSEKDQGREKKRGKFLSEKVNKRIQS